MNKVKYLFPTILILFFCAQAFPSFAQVKTIHGIVKDQQSDERVPFASVRFKKSGVGKLADSSGSFSFHFDAWPYDTLEITSVGYKDYTLAINSSAVKNDSLLLQINMEPGKFNIGVVVKAKGNRGLWMWRRIVQHKPENDRYRFNNFSYELYNKLELDLKNINKEKIGRIRLLRPFNFVLDNIDSSDGSSFLPAYLTEAISHYYYQKAPLKRREVFKGVKTLGMKNESVSKLLGGMDQVVNFYNNFIPVFDKQFVSPISDNGDAYYNYKIADTQYVGGRRLIHFLFTPKRKGESTFEGDCWVHDTTFAIQKMNLRLSKEANINFVERLSLIQEYQLINDSTWFLAKDKFVVDIHPLGKSNLAFIGRKTTTYRDVVVNSEAVVKELEKNRKIEETIMTDEAAEKKEAFWNEERHEQLTETEQSIYTMIDTILNSPSYTRYSNTIYFLTVGYKNIGNYEIGPWYNWVSSNSYEGLRLRFDLGTNTSFSKKVFLHGYLAYGFKDEKWKHKLDVTWLLNKNPRTHFSAAYSKDMDYGQSYYGEITQDNVFAMAIRKANVPMKFLLVDEKKLEFHHEWINGFSARLSAAHKTFDPLRNLPPKELFVNGTKFKDIATSEISLRLRFAFLEKFLESTFNRISLGSVYPIPEVRLTKGISNVFNSNYDYYKLSASVSDFLKVSPFGNIYYNLFAGKTFGTLPYVLLDIAPGNEIYYYNKYAFNMMNRFEFIHDRYAGFNFEHNFGNGIFRYTSLTRKLKFRQFWTAKGLWGGLSPDNKSLNFIGDYPFQSLDKRTYLEVGTGVDNILKVLRVDFIWRLSPLNISKVNSKNFGVFGSFRLAF